MRKIVLFFMILTLFGFYTDGRSQEALQVTGPENVSQLTFQAIGENKSLVSVLDAEENPILGLLPKDFTIKKGRKIAKILSVEPLETSEEVGLNIVLVVDNSFSMKRRKAIQPLLSALEEFYGFVRPIDNIHAIVFDQKDTININGRKLHARTFQSSNVAELRSFVKNSYFESLTEGTFLYDSIVVGLDIIRKMPTDANKFLVVFTDGEDINSSVTTSDVRTAAEGIPNFSSYALDFTKAPTADAFLKSFSKAHGGRVWKAASSAELLPIFKEFSTALLHQYVVTYRFLAAPQGTPVLDQKEIIIEEVTTIDSAPLLNFVFFEEGGSEISEPYILFTNQSGAKNFSEEKLRGTMQKYRHLLNIIGKRLTEHPDARITIIGCNSNKGPEKGNRTLSRNRAESVHDYLNSIWGIDPGRMEVKAQNLPSAPSSSNVPEGIAENQRVEIYSDDPAILDTIKSTYVQEMTKTKIIRVLPNIQSEAGIADWKVYLRGGEQTLIGTVDDKGELDSAYTFNLESFGLKKIAAFDSVTGGVEVSDKEGEVFKNESAAASVKFLRRQERMARKEGYRVLEKYALILFDYDSAEIEERNKTVVDRIINRMKELHSVEAKIEGHTDNIGKEKYNLKLSERRAQAVFDQMVEAGMVAGENVTSAGVGPYGPLYDNSTPEGRALNRTVTVTLEYEEK